MEDILEVVRASCADKSAIDLPTVPTSVFVAEQMHVEEQEEPWDAQADENGEFFDDTGEGAGVEGDLDMEDD